MTFTPAPFYILCGSLGAGKTTLIKCLLDFVPLDSGSIDLPLRYDPPSTPRHVVDHELGKHALTYWRVLERCGERSFEEVLLGVAIPHPRLIVVITAITLSQ